MAGVLNARENEILAAGSISEFFNGICAKLTAGVDVKRPHKSRPRNSCLHKHAAVGGPSLQLRHDRYLRLAVDRSFAVTRRLGARDRRLAGRAAAWRRSAKSAFSTALATLLTSVLSAAASSGVISLVAACDLRALPDRSTRYFTR
jgi:hypothetical protein